MRVDPHLMVYTTLAVAVEFPETHGDFRIDVWGYFMAMEKELRLGMGYFCNADLKKRFGWRAVRTTGSRQPGQDQA